MAIKEIISKIAEKIKERKESQNQGEEIPDDVTRDKYLRSLRRQRRVQLEEVEKESLKQQIKDFEKKRLNRDYFGSMESDTKKKSLAKAIKKKKINIWKQKNMFKEKKLLHKRKSNRFRKSRISKGKNVAYYRKSDL